MLLEPLPANGACTSGSPPSYEDVTYVKVAQYSLVGQQWPSYTYEGAYYRFGQHGPHASVTLEARRAAKIRGTYVAVDPMRSFAAIVAVLEKDDFFTLRLQPTKSLYIDGPEDAITVSRCGVTETLGTAAGSDEMDLQDAQAKVFFAVESDLRGAIFSQQWEAPRPRQ